MKAEATEDLSLLALILALICCRLDMHAVVTNIIGSVTVRGGQSVMTIALCLRIANIRRGAMPSYI